MTYESMPDFCCRIVKIKDAHTTAAKVLRSTPLDDSAHFMALLSGCMPKPDSKSHSLMSNQ